MIPERNVTLVTRVLALGLAILLTLINPLSIYAQSGGNCSIFRSWITGDALTAGDLTSSFSTVGVTNGVLSCIDGISDTLAGMQTTTNPYASDTESLATSGAGEIQRLRYVIETFFGLANWYRVDSNVNFGGVGLTKTGIDGAGLGAHVTAVGLHTWSGSQRFPAITGGMRHTTGLFWPAAHHLAIAIDPATDADKAGVEMFRFHAQGMTMHHTAAIMFRHSAAWNPQWQYPHVTAISLSRGLASATGNEAAGRDTLLFGHAGAVMNLVGYGASHIALGTGSYVALGRHVGILSPAVPRANALYADTIPKAWGQVDGVTSFVDAFGVASVAQAGDGTYILTWEVPFLNTGYVVVVTSFPGGVTGTTATIESQATTHAVVRTWSALGTPGSAINAFFNFVVFGRR